MFLSLAECWRLASLPHSSWKDLRALDRVAAEAFYCKKARLSTSSSTSKASSMFSVILRVLHAKLLCTWSLPR